MSFLREFPKVHGYVHWWINRICPSQPVGWNFGCTLQSKMTVNSSININTIKYLKSTTTEDRVKPSKQTKHESCMSFLLPIQLKFCRFTRHLCCANDQKFCRFTSFVLCWGSRLDAFNPWGIVQREGVRIITSLGQVPRRWNPGNRLILALESNNQPD